MKVLIGSPAFPPSLGGIELFAEQLATGLAARGDDVTVMTSTPAKAPDIFPFQVLRCPGPLAKLRAVRECEVFFQANVALKDLWPLLFCRRPWVVSHHGLYATRGFAGLLGRFKTRLARVAENAVSVSRFVADQVDPRSQVIGNPYRSDLFRILDGVDRTRDVIFVGRLVSDKGVQVLLEAMAITAAQGHRFELAIAGDGPEAVNLHRFVQTNGLSSQVSFLGRLEGQPLAVELNRSRILAVPSVVEEGFGLVALEGIACGCWVVASDSGGLREAIGAFGSLVPAGDPEALARDLIERLTNRNARSVSVEAQKHLDEHREDVVVDRYREVLVSSLWPGRP